MSEWLGRLCAATYLSLDSCEGSREGLLLTDRRRKVCFYDENYAFLVFWILLKLNLRKFSVLGPEAERLGLSEKKEEIFQQYDDT